MNRFALFGLAFAVLAAPAAAQTGGASGGVGGRPVDAGPSPARRPTDPDDDRPVRPRQNDPRNEDRRSDALRNDRPDQRRLEDPRRSDDRRGDRPDQRRVDERRGEGRRFDPGGAGACLTVQGVCAGYGAPRGAACSCNGVGGITQ